MRQLESCFADLVEIKIWNHGPIEGLLNEPGLMLLAIDSSVLAYAALNDIRSVCFQDIFIPFVKHTINWRIEDVIPVEISSKIYFMHADEDHHS